MIKLLSTLVAATLCLTALVAEGAGFGCVDVPPDPEGPAMRGTVWSPCVMPPQDVVVGRTTLPGVKDCPIAGDRLPFVVISHGRGGDFIGHHDTAETLAVAGFIVAAISHPGDTVSDMSRSGDLSVMIERPTDIKRLIDFMVGTSPAASKIDPERISFFGFSRGGYTGLGTMTLAISRAYIQFQPSSQSMLRGTGRTLAAGGNEIRTHGPPAKRDGVFRDHPDRPPPLLLPRIKREGPRVRIHFPPADSLVRT